MTCTVLNSSTAFADIGITLLDFHSIEWQSVYYRGYKHACYVYTEQSCDYIMWLMVICVLLFVWMS